MVNVSIGVFLSGGYLFCRSDKRHFCLWRPLETLLQIQLGDAVDVQMCH